MKVNFANIKVTDIDGTEETVDISKELGKTLYRTAIRKEGLDIAKELYENGEIEVDAFTATALKQLISTNFLAIIQSAIIPTLEDIIASEKEVEEVEPSVEEVNTDDKLSE